jgi:hypothetical protein
VEQSGRRDAVIQEDSAGAAVVPKHSENIPAGRTRLRVRTFRH